MGKKIKIELPDGAVLDAEQGDSVDSVVSRIGPGLRKNAVMAFLDQEPVDLAATIENDASLRVVTTGDPEALEVLRHSVSHVMAQAVKRLYPGAVLAIGPAIEEGFYYDFDLEATLSDADLLKIEKEMARIVKEDLPVSRVVLSREEALRAMEERKEPYKVEILEEIEDSSFSFYSQGEFLDLCRGPHLESTGKVKAFKLLSVAGAYWRGDSTRQMLQRIYGTAFFSKKELKEHLALIEEAKKRDHRRIGRDLDLFSFHPEAPANAFFHPKGAFVYNSLVDYVRGLYEPYGFSEVITPQILTVDLWHRSGHYGNYQENMFFTSIDNREYAVKPMNCPSHVMIFKTKVRSYRDLPIRYADFGRLHRYELSGVTSGLTRVRSFSQDDGHIFCAPEQIEREVRSQIEMFLATYAVFGFEKTSIYISTRPEKSIGSDEIWELSERALRTVLHDMGHEFEVDPGGGVFYGPKIDFKVQDAMKREWQLGTIQLDFSMPERFDLEYVTTEGDRKRPVMIHRAMLGSIERFLGVYIEHCAGAFPPWLAPVQVKLLSVTDAHHEYLKNQLAELQKRGIRAAADLRSEKIGFKIREATLEKVPYMIIIGDREISNSTLSIRERKEGDLGPMKMDEFVSLLEKRITSKT